MTATLTDAPTKPAAPPRRLSDVHAEVRRLQLAGRLDDAILLMRRLVAAVPDEPRLVHDLSALLRRAKRGPDADRVVLRVDPENTAAWRRLAGHARAINDLVEFEWALDGLALADPDDPVATHFLTALRSERGEAPPERASRQYIQQLFDGYAERFDTHLESLGYCVPDAMAETVIDGMERVDQLVGSRGSTLVDLGCGTGLVGAALVQRSTTLGALVGVDLSAGMLRKAAERRLPGSTDRPVYDELVEGDLVDFLHGRSADVDVIVAADVLIYLGNLRPVIEAAFAALTPGGRFIFSVEQADPTKVPSTPGYQLASTGRFEHRTDTLHLDLVDVGFIEVTPTEAVVRHERGEPVTGVVMVATHPAT